MTKAELRQEFLAKRKVLTADEVNHRSCLITQHFIDFLQKEQLVRNTTLIHAFLPIQRQNEIDTWPIVRLIWERFPHIQLAVSVTDATTNTLLHYPLHPTTTLQTNRWGIPEPIVNGQSTIDSAQIDIVLVPLLAFDKQGNRVGYGGGYYDRFLADCRSNCLKIGLSLFEPVESIDNVEPTDIPLSSCLTTEQTYVFD